jgi:mono/diheme cytochrome c family protein
LRALAGLRAILYDEHMTLLRVRPLFVLLVGCVVLCDWHAAVRAADEVSIKRGAYLAAAADCQGCHTDKKAGAPPLSGGSALSTRFGDFYAPNITPDPVGGIGRWSELDFRRAMREGRDDSGRYLYPAFPYTSFTGMSDGDIADLYAFLMAQKPVPRDSRPQNVKLLLRWRSLLFFWRTLFFRPGALTPVAGESSEWNRGRYLAEAVAHCQECHTPRNFLGALDHSAPYAGNPHGPDGNDAPDITSDKQDGIGKWKLDDIIEVLKSGMTPDGEFVGKGMADVVDGTAKLTDADRHAIAVYIKSLPPLRQTPK